MRSSSWEHENWTPMAPLEVPLFPTALEKIGVTSVSVDDIAALRRCILAGIAATAALGLALAALTVPRLGGPALDARLLFAINAAPAKIPGIAGVVAVLDANLAELIIAASVVALWFGAREGAGSIRRNRTVLTVLAFFPTYIIARMLQGAVHHVRPILHEPLHPLSDATTWHEMALTFTDWGSFPSDHAALLGLLAVIAFSLNRGAGLVISLLALCVDVFRVAMGFHWPSDIVGGTLLGVLAGGVVLTSEAALRPQLNGIADRIEAHRALTYPVAFLLLADFAQNLRLVRLLPHVFFHARIFH